jgi:hypothetical protein
MKRLLVQLADSKSDVRRIERAFLHETRSPFLSTMRLRVSSIHSPQCFVYGAAGLWSGETGDGQRVDSRNLFAA